MAITVQYNPSLAAGGQLAFESGRGRFLQEQDRYNAQRTDADRGFGLSLAQFLEGQEQFDETQGLREAQFGEKVRQFDETQDLREDAFGEGIRQFDLGHELKRDQFGEGIRQFDEGLDQRQSEYNRSLRMKADLARLRDSQFQDKLGQEAYEYDRSLAERRYLQERDIQGGLMEQEMRQAGMQQYQQNQFAMEQSAQSARKELSLDDNLSRLQRQQQEMKYRTAMSAASAIEDFTGYRTQEQKQQAIDQWLSQYGELTENQFPFTTPFVKSKEIFSFDQALKQYGAALGPGFSDEDVRGFVSSMGRVGENGEWEWEIPDAETRMGLVLKKAEARRLELEKIADTEIAKAEKLEAQQTEWRDYGRDILQQERDLQRERYKEYRSAHENALKLAMAQKFTSKDGKTERLANSKEIRDFMDIWEEQNKFLDPQSGPQSRVVKLQNGQDAANYPNGTMLQLQGKHYLKVETGLIPLD